MKKRLSLHDKALLALREAVKEVIERHKKEKRPLAVWDWKANKVTQTDRFVCDSCHK